jgi:hypothetical protein|tara:strand:+ start:2221 stop:2526 length:306 start_codon:yes stop_codon:yes gene_type:complete
MANRTANEQRTESLERISRIEEKIDRMTDAIIALARAEEKIVTLADFAKQQGEQILTLINRVDKIEDLVRINNSTVIIINKLFWIVMAAAAAGVAGMFFIQ